MTSTVWLLVIYCALVLLATLASMGGLYASYQLDVPTGAAIVCTLGAALLLAAVGTKLRKQ